LATFLAVFLTTFFGAAFLAAGLATTFGAGFGAGASLRSPAITSLSAFAGRKRAFFEALILIVSPVNGLHLHPLKGYE
jgi:hypothetical protein